MLEELTQAQKSIWLTEKYYQGTSVNTICGTAIIEEKVDFEKLEEAIKILCQKYDNFKLRLKMVNGDIKQELSEEMDFKVDIINVANLQELEREREKIIKKPFKIENSKLYQFYIFKFDNGEGAFIANIHHIISDAWTLAIVCKEVIQIYSNLKQNQEIEKKAKYSYIDCIRNEKEYLESEKFLKDKKYWEERFEKIPEVAVIPGSKSGIENDIKGNRKQFTIGKNIIEKAKKYCKENSISLFNFFMAIFGIYISEISSLDEFVIGTPILNRTNYKEKSVMGMFINTAPLKINLEGVEDFKTFVKNIAIDSLNMLKHQKYSYQTILENLREKNKNIPNLYNILLSYQITDTTLKEGNIKYRSEWTFNGYCADNMQIHIYDLNETDNLDIAYDYKTSIYNEEDIEKLHNRITNIIEQVISQKNIKIKDIDIVTPKEKEQLVTEFNKTELEYDKTKPIIKYFEEQVEKTPNEIAMVFENKKLTYKELNEKANSLAHRLRKDGITNNSIVGIMKERSFEIIIAILAVLKAGGSYIPIAPDYPDDRIEYMLKDSNAKVVLVGKEQISRIKEGQKAINIDLSNEEIYSNNKENLENISKPEDLSYLIYTSGSTGKPKGVMLKQQNLSNFYNAMKKSIKYLNDKKQHKIISITTLSFDIFGFETLMSLTRGLTLYMTNENEQKITSKLEKMIKQNEIEIIQTTPSVMKFHLDNIEDIKNLSSLKYVILAGEQLPNTLVEKLKQSIPGVTIYNGYGPSETTIFSTTTDVTNLEKVSIGQPIANTQIYILNKNQKLLPQGTMGEIYIAGDGVGKGYMNKKEQTEKAYLKNPYIENSIMYKSGDLGSFNEKGEITCYGRIDNQIKINGLRIELGEIEECINSFKSDHLLKSAVIAKKNSEHTTLNAFIIYPSKINKEQLKKYLLEKLPSYMQPNTITKIDKLPFTPNGKIDRKALQQYRIDMDNQEIEYVEPRNQAEEILVETIKRKLKIKEFGIDNNIFDFGADSLTIINIITELFRYNYNIKVSDVYKYQTVREIYENILHKEEKKNMKIDYPEFKTVEEKTKKLTKDVECKEINKKYNVFLTGATGFFGSHLIAELLDHKQNIGKIYCAVRPRKNITAKERLLNKINFYFGTKYNEAFEKYIEVIECEISEEQFALDPLSYQKLQSNVGIVIHAAANVNHYGNYANFVKSNIIATQNIINFCKNTNIKLHYISTMTISGNYLVRQSNDKVRFDENSFYIGQNFEDNVYSKSKLIAESLVIDNMKEKLDATIYRLGDLTGRYIDGGFQENIEKNATYLRLKSILEIGAVPENISDKELEFTPIDYAVKAVRKIIWSDKCKNRIFNIYNPNMLTTKGLLEIIKKYGYIVKLMPKEEFTNLIDKISEDKENQNSLIGIINDFTENRDLIYNYTIEQENKITCRYLKQLGFKWVKVDEKYIKLLLEYMKKVKFIK